MKTKARSTRVTKNRTHSSHKKAVRRRPVHKRVLLHPISWFLLLCVGVLVAGSTFRGQAVTYDVTATVPAQALTQPAVITTPDNEKHVASPLLNVHGTCPDSSYVKLFRNGVFAGVDTCNNGGRFNIQTSLSAGANELRARVFNLTDNEGPASAPVTVYYDLPAPPAVIPPPAAPPPTSLIVSAIEQEPRSTGVIEEVTSRPTVSGLAPPFSDVVVTFYSEPSVCKTKADSKGVWSCTLPQSLPPGLHHVVIIATTPAGKRLELHAFQVRVVEYSEPFVVTSDYTYASHTEGQTVSWELGISGGTAPYTLSIDWGDGTVSEVVRQDRSNFSILHTFSSSGDDGQYPVVITATDARGATTVLQLAAIVKSTVTTVSGTESFFGGITDTVRRWLWVVWPAYIAVVLMAISFWIGEREAYQRFVARRRAGRPRPHARGR